MKNNMEINTEETTLDKIRTRPRFTMFTHLTKEQYAENLKIYLAEHRDEFSGNINKEIATICVQTDYESYWKPRLTLRMETEDGEAPRSGHFLCSCIFLLRSCGWYFFPCIT
jgi:hypothetical protein